MPKTVLLVDDEPAIRKLAGDFLRKAGYDVMEAEDGVAALERAALHAGTIHLLVTDIVMPRMDGLELAERLTAERPGIRVLFISGHPEQILAPDSAFLRKPFGFPALVRRVEEILCPKARCEHA